MKNKGAVAVIIIAIIAVLSLGTWSNPGGLNEKFARENGRTAPMSPT